MKAATAGAATAVDVAFGILTRAQKLTPQQRFVANDATPAASRRFERAWHRLLHTYLERTPSAVHAAVHGPASPCPCGHVRISPCPHGDMARQGHGHIHASPCPHGDMFMSHVHVPNS